MRSQILFFCTILAFSLFLTGCPGGEAPKTNTSSNGVVTNVSDPNKSGSNLTTSKTPTESTTNDAPTIGPVFKAYCDALTRRDEAAVRKLYSQATLKQLEADMKDENEKSLVKYLETDRISNKLCEVRNEKIDGDSAVVEVKTEGAPNGVKRKFVKENGEWKLTNDSPEFDAVKKSAETSNTAR